MCFHIFYVTSLIPSKKRATDGKAPRFADAFPSVNWLSRNSLKVTVWAIGLVPNAPYVENLTLTGNASIWGYGNDMNIIIMGNNSANWLFGRKGNDNISGLAGNDVIRGDEGSDRLLGGTGNDIILGGTDSDYVVGTSIGASTSEVDTLYGSGATGLTGTQVLNDLLTRDTFVLGEKLPLVGGQVYYTKGGNSDHASVKDFYGGVDKIQVLGSISQYAVKGISHSGGSALDTGIYYKNDLIAVIQGTTNVVAGWDFVSV